MTPMPIARYKDLCVDVRNVEAGERFWDQVPDYRLYEVVVDCIDPEPVARWWADVFGARRGVGRGGGWWWIDQSPDCPFEAFSFNPVPEPKTVKNRVHWDVSVNSVQPLLDAGA